MTDETQGDRYAKARADLRDTAKWFAAALAGLGAVLAGGLSFGILPDLGEKHLGLGIVFGAVVVVAILAAVMTVQELLFPKAFSRDRLKQASVQAMLNPYLDELLPSDIGSLEDLWAKYENADSEQETARFRAILSKVTSFAAYLTLQNQVRKANRIILVLFVVVCVCVASLAYLQGLAKRESGQSYVSVRFAPGKDWQDLAAALSRACPASDPISAEGLADKPFEGWWTVRVKQPEACAGAQFSVPAAIVMPGK